MSGTELEAAKAELEESGIQTEFKALEPHEVSLFLPRRGVQHGGVFNTRGEFPT